MISFVDNIYCQKPQALFNYSVLYSPESGPYVETYIFVYGSSVEYNKNDDGNFQAEVDISLVFEKNGVTEDFLKYKVISPETVDTAALKPDIFDQKRIPLPNGIYNIKLTISGGETKEETAEAIDLVKLEYEENNTVFSNVLLIEAYNESDGNTSMSKSGLDLIPYLSELFSYDVDEMQFYTELYNVDQKITAGEEFLVQYYIEESNTEEIMSDYSRFQRHKSNDVNVVIGEFDIKDLPTGEYNIVAEARDRENLLICRKKEYFKRDNPGVELSLTDIPTVNIENSFVAKLNDPDTMAYYLRCIRPTSNYVENRFIDKQQKVKDLILMQQFFFNFWRHRNRTSPEAEWNEYYKQVLSVNENYGTAIQPGFETDRGRVYLQYGIPNTVVGEFFPKQPGEYPYEVWRYFVYQEQRNLIFIFVNTDLVGTSFTLVHSNAKGEISDSRWASKISYY